MFAARFSQASPFTTWTFWDGTAWAAKPPTNDEEYSKALIFEGQGASAAVNFVNGKYVLITLDQGFWATNERFARGAVADSPISGFGKSKKLYAIREYIYGTQVRYYSPNIHPQYDNNHDELLFTYSVNYSTNDNQDYSVNINNQKIVNDVQVTNGGYIDPYFYRVKGVRVPYSLLGIPASIPLAVNVVKDDGLILYPIPAKKTINIRPNSSLEGATYRIFNAQGSQLTGGKLTNNKVNIQSLPVGFYTFVINKEKAIFSERFIKD
ncbi:MAG: T9SS type A sorting domain-containing protein [Paludibacter sp.]